jgi:hypothetical protein
LQELCRLNNRLGVSRWPPFRALKVA